jgi:hypothetical protein
MNRMRTAPQLETGLDWREHIAIDPETVVGKPVVRGTRLMSMAMRKSPLVASRSPHPLADLTL